MGRWRKKLPSRSVNCMQQQGGAMEPLSSKWGGAVRQVSCAVFVICALAYTHAQVSVSLEGRVYDTTGAAIAQASVTVVNPATGFSRSATTTATGDYQIASLPVGDYSVTADKSGFQKQVKKVHLDIGA